MQGVGCNMNDELPDDLGPDQEETIPRNSELQKAIDFDPINEMNQTNETETLNIKTTEDYEGGGTKTTNSNTAVVSQINTAPE